MTTVQTENRQAEQAGGGLTSTMQWSMTLPWEAIRHYRQITALVAMWKMNWQSINCRNETLIENIEVFLKGANKIKLA